MVANARLDKPRIIVCFESECKYKTIISVSQIPCRYSNLDVDTILNSDRLVRNYVDCLLSRKPCSPEGKELKREYISQMRHRHHLELLTNIKKSLSGLECVHIQCVWFETGSRHGGVKVKSWQSST